MILKDGLYRICNSFYCAGFVVKNGLVTECAPILRKKLIAISNYERKDKDLVESIVLKYLVDIAEYLGE